MPDGPKSLGSGLPLELRFSPSRRFTGFFLWLLLAALISAGISSPATSFAAEVERAAASNSENSEKLAAIFAGDLPTNLDDLRAMQAHVQALTRKIMPYTVGVRVGHAHGSGVVINAEGYVLTAAHVAGEPGLNATLILHDGRTVRGRTLGTYRTLDAGLIRITGQPSEQQTAWPHARMGTSSNLNVGQWCLATGHPGGFELGRSPVLRLGRVLSIDENSAITTDCTLIGGDSGGPLFDFDGNVIGIHSRIGGPLNVNLHVPVNTYRTEWARLAAGEAWGHLPGMTPYIGVQGEAEADNAVIVRVMPATPAADAGIRPGDIIVRFGEKAVGNFDSLKKLVAEEQPGTTVVLQVRRGEEMLTLRLLIGNRNG